MGRDNTRRFTDNFLRYFLNYRSLIDYVSLSLSVAQTRLIRDLLLAEPEPLRVLPVVDARHQAVEPGDLAAALLQVVGRLDLGLASRPLFFQSE